MADEQNKLQSKEVAPKSAVGGMGLLQKIVLGGIILVFIIIGLFVVLGGINNFYELIFVLLFLFGLLVIGWFVVFGGQLAFKEKYFSPKEDFFTRTVNLAIDHCPDNIRGCSLFFEGSDWKKNVMGGKIIGCIGLPDYVGEPVYEDVIYKRKNRDGSITEEKMTQQKYMDSPFLGNRKVPLFKNVTVGQDGDTLFIYESGWFVFKRRHNLRCNRLFHSDLNGDVVVYDINPVSYGKFWLYPYKQLQTMPSRIQIQSQLEVILAAHEHQGDLISQSADAGLYANPYMRMIEQGAAEIAKEG